MVQLLIVIGLLGDGVLPHNAMPLLQIIMLPVLPLVAHRVLKDVIVIQKRVIVAFILTHKEMAVWV